MSKVSGKFRSVKPLILPVSKAKVRVRRPSLMNLVIAGGLPSEMTGMALRLAQQGEERKDPSPDLLKELFTNIHQFLSLVLVDLKVVSDPEIKSETEEDEDGFEIGVVNTADMADDDKQYLFLYARGYIEAEDEKRKSVEVGSEQKESFRGERSGSDAGSSRETVQREAEPVAGDESYKS